MAILRYDEKPVRAKSSGNKNLEQEIVMVSTQCRAEFEASLKEGATWEKVIAFLDTIGSVDELRDLTPLVKDATRHWCKPIDDHFLFKYQRWLTLWPDPKLHGWFKRDFPLVAARLDTPQKVRIFFRGAEFCEVSVTAMASVFEDILKKHEVDGQQVIYYERNSRGTWSRVWIILWYTQFEAYTLKELMLPDYTLCSNSKSGRFYEMVIDWRSKEERIAAGESF